MTHVYFVRHAEPNYNNHDNALRELSPKGLADRALVTDYLRDKGIAAVLSSPYKRAADTVAVGSHGTALSTILHHFRPEFGYDGFQRIRPLMPWIVRLDFEGQVCMGIEAYNVFTRQTETL